MTDTSLTIRRNLRRYVDGRLTLQQFMRALAPKVYTVRGATAEGLVDEIYLRFAEFTHGDWNEAELKQIYRPLISAYSIQAMPCDIKTGTGTASSILMVATFGAGSLTVLPAAASA